MTMPISIRKTTFHIYAEWTEFSNNLFAQHLSLKLSPSPTICLDLSHNLCVDKDLGTYQDAESLLESINALKLLEICDDHAMKTTLRVINDLKISLSAFTRLEIMLDGTHLFEAKPALKENTLSLKIMRYLTP